MFIKKKFRLKNFNLLNFKSSQNSGLVAFLLFITAILFSCEKQNETIIWQLDSIDDISGKDLLVSGTPRLLTLKGGKAIEFNGQDAGLLVKSNPIGGWENFLIEVDINPYPGFPDNVEQRFLHIQDPQHEDRRILIELRLNENNQWYGDWFIKTENESLTLVDPTKTHPLEQWATIALKYENGEVTGSVNGEIQVRGSIKYLSPGNSAQTSIGTRMDQRSWFKGAIKEVRFIRLDE